MGLGAPGPGAPTLGGGGGWGFWGGGGALCLALCLALCVKRLALGPLVRPPISGNAPGWLTGLYRDSYYVEIKYESRLVIDNVCQETIENMYTLVGE